MNDGQRNLGKRGTRRGTRRGEIDSSSNVETPPEYLHNRTLALKLQHSSTAGHSDKSLSTASATSASQGTLDDTPQASPATPAVGQPASDTGPRYGFPPQGSYPYSAPPQQIFNMPQGPWQYTAAAGTVMTPTNQFYGPFVSGTEPVQQQHHPRHHHGPPHRPPPPSLPRPVASNTYIVPSLLPPSSVPYPYHPPAAAPSYYVPAPLSLFPPVAGYPEFAPGYPFHPPSTAIAGPTPPPTFHPTGSASIVPSLVTTPSAPQPVWPNGTLPEHSAARVSAVQKKRKEERTNADEKKRQRKSRKSRQSRNREGSDGDDFDGNGENRLIIIFDNYGTIDLQNPSRVGKKGVVPNGLAGSFTMYSERWSFRIDYDHPERGDDGQERACIKWSIRNAAWADYVSLIETGRDAQRREQRGFTLCNKVFREAMQRRAEEYEELARKEKQNPNPNLTHLSNYDTRAQYLRPQKVSEGPLLFGLRHRAVQDIFKASAIPETAAFRPPRTSEPQGRSGSASEDEDSGSGDEE